MKDLRLDEGGSVLVIGDLMLDRYWDGSVDRLSPEAPVAVLKRKRVYDTLGGAGNVARNIKGLGTEVFLVGSIGADEAGTRVRELLADAGIAHDLALTDCNTTTKLRLVTDNHQLLRVDVEDEPSSLACEELLKISNNLIVV